MKFPLGLIRFCAPGILVNPGGEVEVPRHLVLSLREEPPKPLFAVSEADVLGVIFVLSDVLGVIFVLLCPRLARASHLGRQKPRDVAQGS
jgi:hypothetical protein